MINEEKVIMMTKLASYESGEGKGFQLLKSVISATISFLAIFAVYAFYNFENIMQNIYKLDLLAFGKSIIILYLCVVAGYGVISYVVYANRYNKAQKHLRAYYANLKRLAGMYER